MLTYFDYESRQLQGKDGWERALCSVPQRMSGQERIHLFFLTHERMNM